MPLVRRRIIVETRGLVIPADDATLTRHIRRRTAAGVRLNLNLLGEAILSDDEAEQRIARVIDTLRRPDVSYISVKISAICALLDVYCVRPLCRTHQRRVAPHLRRGAVHNAAGVRQSRHGGVRRSGADRRGVSPCSRRAGVPGDAGRHRAAGLLARLARRDGTARRLGGAARGRAVGRRSRCAS